MGLDLDRIKQRQKESAAGSGDGWRPKDGRNKIRVFVFRHKVTEADVKAGHWPKDKVGKTQDELDRPVTIHFGVSESNRPVLSTPALIDRWKKLKGSRDSADQKMARSISPSNRYALNVVDVDERPYKMRNWLCPKSLYNKILRKIADPDLGEAILGIEGRDFVVEFDKDAKSPSETYDISVRDKEKCQKLPSKLNEKVQDFYDPKGFATLGLLDSEAEDEDSDEDEEEDDEDEEEDEEESKPKDKKSSKSKKEEESEEDDEDEEDEDSDEDEEEDEEEDDEDEDDDD